MKIETTREQILPALQSVAGVVERRQTLPVLSNILVDADGEAVTVVATDLEVQMAAHMELGAANAGKVTLPGRKLLDIVKNLDAGSPITIEVNGDKGVVRSGKSRFSLATLPAADFPSLDGLNGGDTLRIQQGELRRILGSVQFAQAVNDARYYLNGLCLEYNANGVRAVATNGHRMSLSDAECSVEAAAERSVILPRKAVQTLIRMLDDAEDEVVLTIDERHAEIACGGSRFTTKLIDGKFPDYNRVIPDVDDGGVTVDTTVIRDALRRVSILASGTTHAVRLRYAPDQGLLSIDAPSNEGEEAQEEISGAAGEHPFEVSFNATYLLDALSAVGGEQTRIGVAGSDRACLIHAATDAPGSQHVVMPLRL